MKFMKDTHIKPNELLFPKQMVIQQPLPKTEVPSIFYIFSIWNNNTESIMGSC